MLIVLAYLVFWCLPRFVTFVYKWIGVENGFSQSVTGSIGYLNALNSLVNVAIYGCKHRQIRDGMLAVLGLAASKYVAGNKIFTTVSSTMNHHR
ncbi:hypothetical protein QR680_019005 [Steinernema hermaphroditum]|nr:hypothetical protein QR680_019005 [Steinernema hermaphroditum]